MNVLRAIFYFGIALEGTSAASANGCGHRSIVDGRATFASAGAVVFSTSKLNVDADGAPNSYLVDGTGLSRTCDGVAAIVDGKKIGPETPNWYQVCKEAWAHATSSGDYSQVSIFGFLAGENNVPIVQAGGDPLPGKAYVSTTTMRLPGHPQESQKAWVDAVTIPYVVLPRSFVKTYGVTPGDVAVVFRPSTGRFAYAVYADGGHLGEASVRLHKDLGAKPIVRDHGIDRAESGLEEKTVTVVFPGMKTVGSADAAAWRQRLSVAGKAAFARWGGLGHLRSCEP